MRTITVVNLKDGSGKSTLAVQLALQWSSSDRIALVDIDPQGSAMLALDQQQPHLEAVRSSGAKLQTLKTALQRQGFRRVVVDTPGSMKDDVAAAIASADLAVMVVRPSYLDLAAAAQTSQLIRQLQRSALVVLNQAPSAREGLEPAIVQKARQALELLRLPVARTMVRSRAVYGRATERGQTVAQLEPGSAAAREIAELGEDIALMLC